jgi:hypothetical protein
MAELLSMHTGPVSIFRPACMGMHFSSQHVLPRPSGYGGAVAASEAGLPVPKNTTERAVRFVEQALLGFARGALLIG